VNHNNEGQQGIEAAFNDQLNGTDGMQWIERDRRGREIISRRGETVPAKNGHQIKLTIDMELQEIMESTLEEAYAYYHPRKIVSVLVEPQTGAIRAMASRPQFERDNMGGTMSNLAIGSQYEPGSVFKIVAYTGVFDKGLASLDETINIDPDTKALAAVKLKEDCAGKGTVARAFAKSSNNGAYMMASRLGADRFLEYVRAFGFGDQTKIELTGEAFGRVPLRHNWNGLTFSRMAIGQSVTVTPLQVVMAVSAIANGGTLMKPQIIEEISDDHGKVLRQLKPQPVRRVCSTKAADLMREAMEGVVNEKGTAPKAAIEGVRVAGKTGTAQLYKDNGKAIHEGHYCVSFAGFAPADHPQFAAIVIVDDPEVSHEPILGGAVAAPIFAQMMKQTLDQNAVVKPQPAPRPALAKGGTP
jgi:cell division protein FtsI/penicillin-binding protein 2